MPKKPTYEELRQKVRNLEKKVSKSKKFEEKLKKSQDLLDDILTASAVGIAHAKDRIIVWANQAMADMFGFTRKERYIGQDTRVLYANEAEYKRIGRIAYEQQKAGKVMEFDAKFKRQDNFLFDGYVKINILDPLDPIKGIIVSIIDITDRKQIEEALKESEEKYRILVENANDSIFVAQDGVIKFPNPKTEDISGYSREELAKMPFSDLIHPEDKDMVLDRHKKRLAGKKLPNTYSFRIVNRDGKELWMELNTVLIHWNGHPATLNFLRDITQQRQLEAQIQQTQRMESLGTLAGGIAHDFNNLLMGIQGNASLILLGKTPDHPDHEKLKNIEQYVQNGADLTKQLLGFARGGKYEVKPTDIHDIIETSSQMFARTKKEIKILRKYQKDIWTVCVDRGQIKQLLFNLYVNAWQAMPNGGNLYLETQNIMLDKAIAKSCAVEPGRYVKITVTDTGVGMDEKTRQHLFEPFFTTKEMGRGTGLGLSSVYGVVKNHAGCINVSAENGKGTTFNIYLPASGKEVPEEKTSYKKLVRGEETILLVDDEDMIIDVGVQLLEKMGYCVLTAKSGQEAIDIFGKNESNIDLVVLDMIMPGINGGDAYKRLKEINSDIKVLLSSGYSINGQAKKILNQGCNGFIQKPFNMIELSQKLREVLDQK